MGKKLAAVPPQPKAPAVESAAGVSLAAAAAADAMAAAAVTPKGLPVDKDEGVFLQRGAELKEEGNKAYNMRDMRTALALYEQARSPDAARTHVFASGVSGATRRAHDVRPTGGSSAAHELLLVGLQLRLVLASRGCARVGRFGCAVKPS